MSRACRHDVTRLGRRPRLCSGRPQQSVSCHIIETDGGICLCGDHGAITNSGDVTHVNERACLYPHVLATGEEGWLTERLADSTRPENGSSKRWATEVGFTGREGQTPGKSRLGFATD